MNSTEEPTLRILMLEDMPTDSALVEHELLKAGGEVNFKRVETRSEFLEELEQRTPSVILSDHGLPSFDGFVALELVRKEYPDVPFIFVTAAMGEEMAIQAFESGAADYVLKSRLEKLVPAVRRALLAATERRLLRQIQTEHERQIRELREALTQRRSSGRLIPICSSCKKIRNEQGQWKAVETFLREQLGATLTHGLCPNCVERFYSQAPPLDEPEPRGRGIGGGISL